MDFEFSPEQEQLREAVRRFLEEQAPVTPYVREMFTHPTGFSEGVWQGLAGLGLTGILVPEAYGGAGLGMLEMGVVLEEMGRVVHPGPFLSTALTAAGLVRDAGSEADRAALLPGIASGEARATLALFEPGRRYEWREPTVTARPASRGGWRLVGEKTHVHDAAAADWLLVTARSDEGLAAFIVEADAGGVEIEPLDTMDGTRKRARVRLRDAAARRLGEGDASEALAATVDRSVIGLCVDGVGAAQRALELCIGYAHQREQFGAPIGSFQAIQHLLADVLRDLELGRAGSYYALWAAEAADAAERHRAAWVAKAFCCEAFPRIGMDAIQVFAGVGFTWEYDVHLFFKRLLSLQSDLGDEATALEAVAGVVLDEGAARG